MHVQAILSTGRKQRRPGGGQGNPARIVVLSFAAAIAVGTLLLLIPAATAPGQQTSLLTALFTATSAVCVTGLTVVSTLHHWTVLGQLIILFLVQVGGLGIMTLSTLMFFLLGRRISMRNRLLIQEALGEQAMGGVVRLARRILIMTFTIELAGALVLTVRWAFDHPLGQAVWLGVFHAVSAFNNAGFDLFGDSLVRYVADPLVNLTILALLVLGGLGFGVISEIRQARATGRRLSLHARLALTVTVVLMVVGTLGVLLLEWNNPQTLGALPPIDRPLAAMFQGVVVRTAGFFTVNQGFLHPITLVFLAGLMFIGASPGSTGGGIKTTTFGVVALMVWTTLSGKEDVSFGGRRLHWSVVNRAIAIAVTAFTLVMIAAAAILAVSGKPFVNVLFEVVSAFATVGASAGVHGGGLTPTLNTWGRVLLVLMMFVGRVGPLTAAFAIARRQRRKPLVRLPEGRVNVG